MTAPQSTLVDRTLERARQQTRFSTVEIVFLGSFFAAFCALAFLFPLSGDDWAWGSHLGSDRLIRHFENYNGRYAGNLTVLLLTRVNILIPFVVAATVTLTLFLLVDLTDNRTKLGYAVVAILFLGMPLGIWRQSVVWLSGFVNYALGSVCLLVYLRALKSEWLGLFRRSVGVRRYLGVFVFGFVSQLFMEHITSYLLAASFVSLVLYRLKFGKFSKYLICWFVAFLSGAVFMLSNGAYRNAASGDPNYQQIGGRSGVRSILHKLGDPISNDAVAQNFLVNLTIALLVCLLVASVPTLSRRLKLVVLGLVTGFLALAYLPRDADTYRFMHSAFAGIPGIAAGLLLLTLCAVARYVIQDERRRIQLYLACASVVVLIGPLMFVEPIGPRCFYPTYLFFLLIVSLLLKELVERSGPGAGTRIAPFLVVAVVALFVSQFAIYGIIHKKADERLAYVQAQVKNGATVVNVKRLPFKGYVHAPDPVGKWGVRYKLFYHLPEKLQINVSTPVVR